MEGELVAIWMRAPGVVQTEPLTHQLIIPSIGLNVQSSNGLDPTYGRVKT